MTNQTLNIVLFFLNQMGHSNFKKVGHCQCAERARSTHLLNKISHISLICVHIHTHTLTNSGVALVVSSQTSECRRGGGGVNEVHSFHSQLAPEARQWGGESNLKEGKLFQQVTEACSDQTRSEVKHSHITGPIWRQHYALHRSPFSHSLPEHRRAVLPPLRI